MKVNQVVLFTGDQFEIGVQLERSANHPYKRILIMVRKFYFSSQQAITKGQRKKN